MFYTFLTKKDETGLFCSVCASPKFRSGETGMFISEADTERMANVIGEDGLHVLVENGILIEAGEWPFIPDPRSWQELCENGEVVYACRKFREGHNCTLREAKDAVDDYREFLKKKYGTKKAKG